MKAWNERLLGDPARVSFEQRVFHLALLVGIVMTFAGTLMDIYYRVGILTDLLFLGCWIISYYFSRVLNRFQVTLVISTCILVFGYLPYIWLTAGGMTGSVPFYTILLFVTVCLFLRGKFRWMMLGAMFLITVLMIVWDSLSFGSFVKPIPTGMSGIEFIIHLALTLAGVIVMLVSYSGTYHKEKQRSDAYAKAIEENYGQQLYYMENLEQVIQRLKSERHDFNNHLGVLYGLLQNGDAEKAKAYAAQQVKNAQEYQNIVWVPHPMVRALLNYKLSAAREAGIDLRLSVNMPEELKLDESDVTVILGNLLDNAAEACAALPEERRWLSLTIEYKPDYLVLRVANTVAAGSTPGGLLHTSKADAENHGFGLKNIEYLVNKHNGFLEVLPEEGEFRVNVALLVRFPE